MNDSVQVDDYLAADPIDVVAAFTAQRPCHRSKRTRIRLVTVVFVSADVAILAKGASHVAGREENCARTFRAAVKELFTGVMEMRADPRSGSELASAELRAHRTVDTAIPRTEIAVGKHPIGKLAAQLEQARPVCCWRQWRARSDCLPPCEKYRRQAVELGPERLFPGSGRIGLDWEGRGNAKLGRPSVLRHGQIPRQAVADRRIVPDSQSRQIAHGGGSLPLRLHPYLNSANSCRANPNRPFLRPTAAAIIAAGCSKLRVEPSSGRIGDDTAAAEAFWLGPGRGRFDIGRRDLRVRTHLARVWPTGVWCG